MEAMLGVVTELLEVAVLTTGLEDIGIEGFVDIHAIHNTGENLVHVGLIFLIGVLLPEATKCKILSIKLVLNAFDIAFAETDPSVTTHLVTEEADVAVAVVFAISP